MDCSVDPANHDGVISVGEAVERLPQAQESSALQVEPPSCTADVEVEVMEAGKREGEAMRFSPLGRQGLLAEHDAVCTRARTLHLARTWAQINAKRQADAKLARSAKLAAAKLSKSSAVPRQRPRGAAGVVDSEAAGRALQLSGDDDPISDSDNDEGPFLDPPALLADSTVDMNESGDIDSLPPAPSSQAGLEDEDVAVGAAGPQLHQEDGVGGTTGRGGGKRGVRVLESDDDEDRKDGPSDPALSVHGRPGKRGRLGAAVGGLDDGLPQDDDPPPGGGGVSDPDTAFVMEGDRPVPTMEATCVALFPADGINGEEAASVDEAGQESAEAAAVPSKKAPSDDWLTVLGAAASAGTLLRLPPDPPRLVYPEDYPGSSGSASSLSPRDIRSSPQVVSLAEHPDLCALVELSNLLESLSRDSLLAAPRDPLPQAWATSGGTGRGPVRPYAQHSLASLRGQSLPPPGCNVAALSGWQVANDEDGASACCLRELDGAHVGACIGELALEEQRRGARRAISGGSALSSSGNSDANAAAGGSSLSAAQQVAGVVASIMLRRLIGPPLPSSGLLRCCTVASSPAVSVEDTLPPNLSDVIAPSLPCALAEAALIGSTDRVISTEPPQRSLGERVRTLRALNDVLLATTYSSHTASLGGGRSGAASSVDRLAALSSMSALEASRQLEASEGLSVTTTGRSSRRVPRFRHHLSEACPVLGEDSLVELVRLGQYGARRGASGEGTLIEDQPVMANGCYGW